MKVRAGVLRLEAIREEQLETVALHRIGVFGCDRAPLVQIAIIDLAIRSGCCERESAGRNGDRDHPPHHAILEV